MSVAPDDEVLNPRPVVRLARLVEIAPESRHQDVVSARVAPRLALVETADPSASVGHIYAAELARREAEEEELVACLAKLNDALHEGSLLVMRSTSLHSYAGWVTWTATFFACTAAGLALVGRGVLDLPAATLLVLMTAAVQAVLTYAMRLNATGIASKLTARQLHPSGWHARR